MLLRRITEHVKAQNWTAVALDFVIVVVGVFIGIQVSNWNGARVDKALADTYLSRLHADLTMDVGALNRRIVFWADVIEYGETAIRYHESGVRNDQTDWEVLLAFYQASQIWKYDASDPTYEELKGGGKLSFIKSAGLRSALAGYYEDLDRRAGDLYGLNPEYREIIRAKTPYQVQTYIWRACHEGDGAEQKLLDCPRPDHNLDVAAVLENFVDDPRVIESLRFWIVNLSITRGQGVSEIERLKVLAEMVRQERGDQ